MAEAVARETLNEEIVHWQFSATDDPVVGPHD
jgi:hypothetical protein